MRRILLIAVILVVAAGIVTVGMLLRGAQSPEPAVSPDGLPILGTLPVDGTGIPGDPNGAGVTTTIGTGMLGGPGPSANDFRLVAQAAVLDYAVHAEGVTLIAPNGAVIAVSSSEAIVAQASFENIMGAWSSPQGKWLLVKSGGPNSLRWSVLEVAKRTWKDIPANTTEMAWSPSGEQLAYLARRTDGIALTLFNPRTNTTRTVFSLAAPELTLEWQDASHILIMDRPNALVPGTAWNLETTSATLRPFIANVAGIQVLWGGPMSGGLLFRAGPTGGTLSLIDADGGITQTAGFLTLPSKCVFGESAATSSIPNMNSYLFCAIPRDASLMRNHQLPDDYLKGTFGTADSLYMISILNGSVRPIIPKANNMAFDAANLKAYGDALYFVNRNDKKLYAGLLSELAVSEPEAIVAE